MMAKGTSGTRMRIARLVVASIVVAGLPLSQAAFAPSAGAAVNVVVNGSFETGTFSGWQVQNHPCPHYPWTVFPAGQRGQFGFATTQPQDGVRVASNGFDGCPGRFAISQVVTLPPGTSEISWSDRYQWNMRDYGGPTA